MNIIGFLYNNMLDILIILCGLFGLVLFYKNDNKRTVKQIILNLVVKAEKILGDRTGSLKYAYVISELYIMLPSSLKILYTYSEINKYIEEEVKFLNDLMELGVSLKGYDEEHK